MKKKITTKLQSKIKMLYTYIFFSTHTNQKTKDEQYHLYIFLIFFLVYCLLKNQNYNGNH